MTTEQQVGRLIVQLNRGIISDDEFREALRTLSADQPYSMNLI
jgi:hypothetical protein